MEKSTEVGGGMSVQLKQAKTKTGKPYYILSVKLSDGYQREFQIYKAKKGNMLYLKHRSGAMFPLNREILSKLTEAWQKLTKEETYEIETYKIVRKTIDKALDEIHTKLNILEEKIKEVEKKFAEASGNKAKGQ